MAQSTGRQSLEEQLNDYRELVAVVIERAIGGEQLTHLQTATDYWHKQRKEEWLEQIASGNAYPLWFDVPDAMEKDEVFLDVVDHPSYIDLREVITGGNLLLGEPFQVRATPPWPVAYAAWHPDREGTVEVQPKMQIDIDDVPENSGEFAYVPGSHLTTDGTRYRPQRNDTIPGHKRLPGKAGTVIIFDNAGLHTAMDNCTATPRKSMIIGYRQGCLAAPEDRFDSAAKCCKTSRRRRLLELEV